mmetsp:Transcript_27618/g.95497  ORF Transcript_27618/g.95497 Transcript_27618/m.95497 type:complete len:152 (-) Transcript_27618:183-638(-)|eukprot:CAMPEP_0203815966 /NCGR_PEP_ID=MMETSP0115-20131106/13854_1 /ASSEMBLY_ACC=CAM_ASM_000227 /TAXON_ID=33651 /ORGANISM="Bicosoecid sp, Strain ms1" /LENGTH=151 /DNA_ID=CAMNT_0050724865 /DNA_START=259 /DNA_END=714 /DNA_ORIENTATION=+
MDAAGAGGGAAGGASGGAGRCEDDAASDGGSSSSPARAAVGSAARDSGSRPAAAAAERVVTFTPRPLQVLALEKLAEHADKIADLRGVPGECVGALLFLVLRRGRLTVPLARVFMSSGVEEVEAFFRENVDLLGGIRSASEPSSCRPGGRD